MYQMAAAQIHGTKATKKGEPFGSPSEISTKIDPDYF